MERAVLFFDIDGTILSEITRTVPESAVTALKAAQAAGHLLFINTGRTVSSLPAEITRIGFDGYLCGCGTYLIFRDQLIFSRSIDEKRGRAIIRKAGECDVGCVAEGVEDVYFPERMTRFDDMEQSRRYFRNRGMGIEKPLERGGFTFDKVFIYSDDRSDLDRFFAFVSEDMDVIDRGGGAYEIVQKGYSKATACEYILKKLDIPKERAYVFGDSGNDLPMFEYADHAIAMGKHAAVLEPYTEFVTRTVEDGGIAYALRHYGLIN